VYLTGTIIHSLHPLKNIEIKVVAQTDIHIVLKNCNSKNFNVHKHWLTVTLYYIICMYI